MKIINSFIIIFLYVSHFNPRKNLKMFLYNSFDKWLRVTDQNCTNKAGSFLERKPDDSEKEPLVRKKHNQQQTKAIF